MNIYRIGHIGMLCLLLLLVACGKSPNVDQTHDIEGNDGLVTLTMLQDAAPLSDEDFTRFIAEPVRKKYPNISVELQRITDGLPNYEYRIVKGEFPDILFTTHPKIMEHRRLESALNLMPFLAQHEMNLAKFDKNAIELIQYYGTDDQLLALPFSLDFSALFYNQDLFEKSNMAYPKDGMTWEEAIALSQRFFQIGDQRTYGLAVPGIAELGSQLSLHFVNPKTGRSDIHTDGWKKILLFNKDINDIKANQGALDVGFVEQLNVAMMASYSTRIANLKTAHDNGRSMNWDMTQFPSHPENMNKGLGTSGRFLIISSISKHQKEALQVLSVITSEENQLAMNKQGSLSALNDPQMKLNFGIDNDFIKNKNIQGVFKSEAAKPYAVSDSDSIVIQQLIEASKEIMGGVTDLNDMFRKWSEEADRRIAAKEMGF